LKEKIKVAFASGPDDLNRELVERMAALFPELPLYVISEFPPESGRNFTCNSSPVIGPECAPLLVLASAMSFCVFSFEASIDWEYKSRVVVTFA